MRCKTEFDQGDTELRLCVKCRLIKKVYKKKNPAIKLRKIKEYIIPEKRDHSIYYRNNLDKVRLASNVYYHANKDAIKPKSKKYYDANKEKMLAYGRAYRIAKKEELEAKRKVYYDNNRELFKTKQLNYRQKIKKEGMNKK
tara:strand:- start:297 stop:719 length:423 start_codon:yes stop_codon:yes gene_type:complete